MIISFICLMLPAVISIAILEKLFKKKFERRNLLYMYTTYLIIINLILLFTLNFIFNDRFFVLNGDSFSNIFAFKYLLFSLILAIVLPIIHYLFASKKIKFNLKRKPENKSVFKYNIKKIISILILFVSLILLFGIKWYNNNFENVTLEQLMFHIKVPLNGTDTSVFQMFISDCIIPSLITTFIISLLTFNLFNRQLLLISNFKKKREFKIIPIGFVQKFFLSLSIILFLIASILVFTKLDMYDYIKAQIKTSTIFEDYYVDANDVEITFPENKKNIIHIYVESLETSFTATEKGGIMNDDLIPNLSRLAYENTSFSNTDDIGGAYQAVGTTWTIAGMVAQTSGLPLKVPIDGNEYGSYSMLPNITTFGDILNKEGYTQVFALGSDVAFGGRETYFKQHGNYELHDIKYFKEQNMLRDDYNVFWGMEDSKLFEFAKRDLEKLNKENKPFNYSLLTVNTHFPGYLEDSCPDIYDSELSNVISCSDQQIYDFVLWIQKQKFYDNTVIVISGDHLFMQDIEYFSDESNKQRRIFSTIINSDIEYTINDTREYTTFDLFPTILSSMGVEIEGERLGLGTNLFSNKKTIVEEIGKDNLNYELSKKSVLYNTFLENKN